MSADNTAGTDTRDDDDRPKWRSENGVYITGDQPDKLLKAGYITTEERETLRNTGIVTVESASGDDITLCPDMWMAPDTITPIVNVLGDRLGNGVLH